MELNAQTGREHASYFFSLAWGLIWRVGLAVGGAVIFVGTIWYVVGTLMMNGTLRAG